MLSVELANQLIHGKPWHHDFEIIPGVRTHGSYNPEGMWNELGLPLDMTGLSLADVGASNGYFSFEACKRGARTVAFDYRSKEYSGFGLAQSINGLNDIEHHNTNVLDIKVETFGRFDIVLALGLLYHTSDPYLALANCAALSSDRLFIESYCIDSRVTPELAAEPFMQFFPDPKRFAGQGQPNNDRTNFWGFTSTCLRSMVEDMGFAVIRQMVHGDRVFLETKRIATSPADTRLHLAYGLINPADIKDNPFHTPAFLP